MEPGSQLTSALNENKFQVSKISQKDRETKVQQMRFTTLLGKSEIVKFICEYKLLLLIIKAHN